MNVLYNNERVGETLLLKIKDIDFKRRDEKISDLAHIFDNETSTR
ncbi:hypothetical protein ACFFHM_22640 [Halalkalibacter kiskunsagensis]|uniref:Uncharacterized protein n=1 Tax=Halalkalibacter kiskunsagensis TaxID=1548599 RepID=A0ABV6KMH9_9BACI